MKLPDLQVKLSIVYGKSCQSQRTSCIINDELNINKVCKQFLDKKQYEELCTSFTSCCCCYFKEKTTVPYCMSPGWLSDQRHIFSDFGETSEAIHVCQFRFYNFHCTIFQFMYISLLILPNFLSSLSNSWPRRCQQLERVGEGACENDSKTGNCMNCHAFL